MKKFIIFIVLFTFSFAFAQMSGARLEFIEDGHDFGNIKEGTIAEHIFNFINLGSDTLFVKNISTSCGCTAGILSKSTILPGEKGSIKVSFDSQGRIGAQTKIIYVTSNDVDKPSKTLMIKANVLKELPRNENASLPRIQFQKVEHDYGKIAAGKVYETIFKFRNVGKGVLEIKDIKTSCGCTAANISKKLLQPDESGEIKVELDTAGRQGSMIRTVTVFSNDPENGMLTLKITAEVIGS